MYFFFKRLLDISISFTLLVLLSPLLLIVSLAIKIEDFSSPIIYKGERSASRDETFFLYKFRTMIKDAESLGGPSTVFNDPRLTFIGKLLRKYKIDEIPQLLNVLFGEMSLVGPRPQVLFYTKKYKGEFLKILDVKPGVTDLSSLYFLDMDSTLGTKDVDLKYQSEIEPIKNRLRLKYINEMSFKLDLVILIETFLSLIGLKGAIRFKIKED